MIFLIDGDIENDPWLLGSAKSRGGRRPLSYYDQQELQFRKHVFVKDVLEQLVRSWAMVEQHVVANGEGACLLGKGFAP